MSKIWVGLVSGLSLKLNEHLFNHFLGDVDSSAMTATVSPFELIIILEPEYPNHDLVEAGMCFHVSPTIANPLLPIIPIFSVIGGPSTSEKYGKTSHSHCERTHFSSAVISALERMRSRPGGRNRLDLKALKRASPYSADHPPSRNVSKRRMVTPHLRTFRPH